MEPPLSCGVIMSTCDETAQLPKLLPIMAVFSEDTASTDFAMGSVTRFDCRIVHISATAWAWCSHSTRNFAYSVWKACESFKKSCWALDWNYMASRHWPSSLDLADELQTCRVRSLKNKRVLLMMKHLQTRLFAGVILRIVSLLWSKSVSMTRHQWGIHCLTSSWTWNHPLTISC